MSDYEDPGTAVVVTPEHVELGTLRADTPGQVIEAATAVATPLAELIKKRKLAVGIQGREYVKCEGWTTLGVMLGVTPHEVTVTEAEGIFTATVELRRIADGRVVGRASAECGAPDELDRAGNPLWANRPRYARRSMALTRATAKAFRLAFSWIMVLAGYQPTPAEEIPADGAAIEHATEPKAAAPASGPVVPFGERKGQPIAVLDDDEIAKLKTWCEKKDAGKFATLIEQLGEEQERRRAEGS